MRWLVLLGSLVVLVLGACDTSSTIDLDFGLVLPGCRAPSACYKMECDCNFATVNQLTSADPTGCLVCDPNADPNGVCTCDTDGGPPAQCVERAQVCVGHGSVCNGLCVRKGAALGCMDPNAEPPDEVASVVNGDGGPGSERRCPYADDLCCN